jgi:hypothetical protein
MLLTIGILTAAALPQEAAVQPTPPQLPHQSPDLRFELGLRVRLIKPARC